MIDAEGYRANVGIILADGDGRLFWGRRVGGSGWQFPQGGIEPSEDPESALWRELGEEVGLGPEHVELLARTGDWLRYRLPPRYRRQTQPVCIGQKQMWFLLRLQAPESALRLDASGAPEFESWRWVDYWTPLTEVVFFKRGVYAAALDELAPHLFGSAVPARPVATRRR